MASFQNDIRYRGPLSYRGLRIIALLLMTASGLANILLSVANLIGMGTVRDMVGGIADLAKPVSIMGQMSFPLLLISTFSRITQKRNAIIRAVIGYFLASAALYTVIVIFLQANIAAFLEGLYDASPMLISSSNEIIATIANNLIGSMNDSSSANAQVFRMVLNFLPPQVQEMLPSIAKLTASLDMDTLEVIISKFRDTFIEQIPSMSYGISISLLTQVGSVNVFLDLFLCSLFYFFTFYKPGRMKGGKLLIFRLCAAIPVEYVFLSFVLIGLCKVGNIKLPLPVMALLTYRRPAAFIIFLAMCVYLKFKEVNDTDKGLSEETHLRRMSTNRSSLRYSIFLCVVLLIISGCEYLSTMIPRASYWRLGSNYWMFLAIPLILLFSYSRDTKYKWPDKVILLYYPVHYCIIVLAWANVVIIFLETLVGVDALRNMPFFSAMYTSAPAPSSTPTLPPLP